MEATLTRIPVRNLELDSENPRFVGKNILFDKKDEGDIINHMIKEEALFDLINSIAEQGYFDGEPLLVVKNETNDNYLVIEGNRRLSALKVLNKIVSPTYRKEQIEELINNKKYDTDVVPCIVYKSREDADDYLGYRHITGTQQWSTFAKARFLNNLLEKSIKSSETPDIDVLIKNMAKKIGSKGDYVRQLLNAYNSYSDYLERCDTPSANLVEVESKFSLFTTSLSYKNINDFINLPSNSLYRKETENPISTGNIDKLLLWIYGDNNGSNKAVKESRQLNILNKVLVSPEARNNLLRTNNLEDSEIYSSHLLDSYRELMRKSNDLISKATLILMQHVSDSVDSKDIEIIEGIEKKLQNMKKVIER